MSTKLFHLGNMLLEWIFPTQCIGCTTYGIDICDTCLESVQPPRRQLLKWITSFGNYHDPCIKDIIWHIKKYPNMRMIRTLSDHFATMIANRPENPNSWILIPIPISTQRFRERGFNQSLLLAQGLGISFQLPVYPVLKKIHHTAKQGTAPSKEHRTHNILGSFGIYKKSQPLLVGKNCILIDDVTTTGSTLIEARDVVLRAGAARVIAWTIAH